MDSDIECWTKEILEKPRYQAAKDGFMAIEISAALAVRALQNDNMGYALKYIWRIYSKAQKAKAELTVKKADFD